MNKKPISSKGVSASGLRKLAVAISVGFSPSPTSTGPVRYLRNLAKRRGK